jgi:hypothetical protein
VCTGCRAADLPFTAGVDLGLVPRTGIPARLPILLRRGCVEGAWRRSYHKIRNDAHAKVRVEGTASFNVLGKQGLCAVISRAGFRRRRVAPARQARAAKRARLARF